MKHFMLTILAIFLIPVYPFIRHKLVEKKGPNSRMRMGEKVVVVITHPNGTKTTIQRRK